MGELLPNAPLERAVFEVRFPGEPAVEGKRHEFFEKIRDEFPKVYVPRAKEGTSPSLQHYQFRNETETENLAVAINSFYYICFKYQGFKSFKSRFLKYFQIFTEIYPLRKLSRTGLRYIDHIPILRERGIIPLADYLNFGFRIPDSIPENLELIQASFTTELTEGKLHLGIQYQQVEEPVKREVLVLDFDHFFEEEIAPSEVESYIDASHRWTKKIFLDLVSEKYLAIMKGETA